MASNTDSEGYEYKKGLLKLLQSGKIALSDLKEINISSDEEDTNDESDVATNAETTERTAEVKKEMTKFDFDEAQKSLDDIPSLVAQFNTELEFLSRDRMVLQTNDCDLEEFVWRFNITIEWQNVKYTLPIQRVDDIQKLNDALSDEAIYHYVVSFDCSFA